jgi:hypothetical protein
MTNKVEVKIDNTTITRLVGGKERWEKERDSKRKKGEQMEEGRMMTKVVLM